MAIISENEARMIYEAFRVKATLDCKALASALHQDTPQAMHHYLGELSKGYEMMQRFARKIEKDE